MTTAILLLDTLVLGVVAVVALIQAGTIVAKDKGEDPAAANPARRKLAIVAGLAAGCLQLAFASVPAARANQ